MKTKFLILLAIAFFISCNKNNNEITESSFIGTWIYSVENKEENASFNDYDKTYVFNRVEEIEGSKSGLVFKEEEGLVRKSVNDDKPQNIKGSWVFTNNTLSLSRPTAPFIPSDRTDVMNNFIGENYQVIEISDKILKLKRKRTKMSDLYDKIWNLSESTLCDGNTEDWAAAPIGHKKCGGPTHFIPYNKKMDDIEKFLGLIKEYTDLQIASEKKSNLVSDCSVVQPPKSIECYEGRPLMLNVTPKNP